MATGGMMDTNLITAIIVGFFGFVLSGLLMVVLWWLSRHITNTESTLELLKEHVAEQRKTNQYFNEKIKEHGNMLEKLNG